MAPLKSDSGIHAGAWIDMSVYADLVTNIRPGPSQQLALLRPYVAEGFLGGS
jgi:hypothetical protein